MTSVAIAQWILERTGLNPESLGARNVERAVAAAMEQAGLANVSDYLVRLQSSAAELEALLDSLVIAETWFFRDREPFVFLKHHVQSTWLASHPPRRLRVLSAPCSTGEEPYSIAMTLLDAGLTPEQFHIDAVDISRRAIETACRAVYRERAFRGNDQRFLNRYFHRIPDGYVLDDRVVQLVNFHTDNLVRPVFLAAQEPYDIVFCRNMVIYLAEPARVIFLEALNRWLVPQGFLITGHSELTFFQQAGYTPVRHARSFACIRNGSTERQAMGHKLGVITARPAAPRRPARLAPCSVAGSVSPVPQVEPDRKSPPNDLDAIRDLADQGALVQARTQCEQFLKDHPPSAEAYCLLGLIQQASGHLDAAEAGYLKALYLEPRCVEALVHLSLCYEHQGNAPRALLYRERARRIESSEKQPALK